MDLLFSFSFFAAEQPLGLEEIPAEPVQARTWGEQVWYGPAWVCPLLERNFKLCPACVPGSFFLLQVGVERMQPHRPVASFVDGCQVLTIPRCTPKDAGELLRCYRQT